MRSCPGKTWGLHPHRRGNRPRHPLQEEARRLRRHHREEGHHRLRHRPGGLLHRHLVGPRHRLREVRRRPRRPRAAQRGTIGKRP